MRKTNKIILLIFLIAVVLIGIGYAAIQNITLNISSQAEAQTYQGNFLVKFIGIPQVSDGTKVAASIINDTNATINVSGLATVGETVSATYNIQNVSTDLSADLTIKTTNSNKEYFRITSTLAKNTLTAGEETTATVTVELTKTPLDSVNTSIEVQITAIPVQPGEEGSSGRTNDFSQSPITLASVTDNNIGDYIDLGNNIINTESTKDDWRILYKDENYAYAILADYLPAQQVPVSAGLNTNVSTYPYSVWSDTNTFLNGILNTTAWSSFTNKIPEATAIGTPTAELLINSYNVKNGTNINYTDFPTLDSTTEDYDLYMPHTDAYNECYGCCLATPYIGEYNIWRIYSNGYIATYDYTDDYHMGIRPVVSLPLNTTAEVIDGVWNLIYTPEIPLSDITTSDIGDYIDLGNDIIGTSATTDDWRIFCRDDNNLYVILADWLPTSKLPSGCGLKADSNSSAYGVYAESGTRNGLLNGLQNTSAWSTFTNGIPGAVASGSPTADLVVYSYNQRNGTNVTYSTSTTLARSDETLDLYMPRTSSVGNTMRTWLSTPKDTTYVWTLPNSGKFYGSSSYLLGHSAVRPVISIPLTITAKIVNGIWVIVF